MLGKIEEQEAPEEEVPGKEKGPAASDASDPLDLEGKRIERYQVEKHLGGGGMGVVYRARDTQLGRTVALKFLPPHLSWHEEAERRFLREARSAAALDHPNVATIHEIGQAEGGQRFIAMAYYEGETLKAKFAREGPLPMEEALDYARQIAEGLGRAHEAGIVHRDIKPANVMVTRRGEVKLVDFGIAKLKGGQGITETGDTLGTISYMAPEQIQGKDLDGRADLFSLGVVFYEMLTGRHPFPGEYRQAIAYQIINEEAEPPSTYREVLSSKLDKVVLRCLEKRPEDRYGSAGELLSDLEEAMPKAASSVSGAESSGSTAGAEGLLSGQGWLRRRHVVGLGALAVVVLLIGWWLLGGSVPEEAGEASPGENGAETTGHSIAVLPFEVSGSGAEDWEDGMVTMLSLNLDGAAGLRAIPDRTVFATLREQGFSEEGLGTSEALEVAHEIGARYAVVGSAVQIGEDLRFGADVHETSSGDRLGHVEVRGSPGRVTGLVDDLTRQVLSVLLEGSEQRMPTVDLESLTTESLPALKAYLEGERRFRAGDYEAALERFETAIQQDSTFALAYYRLYGSMVWSGRFEGFRSHLERAYELSGRLPLRERRKMWASYTWNIRFRALVARDSLRHFTEVYPEDPKMWNGLAEALFHGNVPGGWAEAERAFLEIEELDPEVAQVHHHLVDLAISLHRDSALATERIAAHPEGDYRQTYQVALGLVFGTDEERQKAFSRLDSIPSSVPYLWIRDALAHPSDQKLQSEVLEAFRKRPDNDPDDYERYTRLLVMSRLERGQVEEAMSLLQEEMSLLQEEEIARAGGACILALSRGLGYPIPNALQRSYLEPAEIEEEDPSPRRLLCTGIYLTQEGRDEEIGALMDRLREWREHAEGRDTARVQVATDELQGYRAWKEGDTEKAERLWSASKQPFWPWGALWRGDLYRELGELEKAEDWYVAAWQLPVAHERLGLVYEEMNRPEEAAEAYERFIEAWAEADEPLQERVEAARARLESLTEEGALPAPQER